MDSMTFVLFGSTGDLAKRKIFPALYNLYLENKLPSSFSVVGLGRKEIAQDVFRENVLESLKEFSRHVPSDSDDLTSFLSTFSYCSLDVTKKEDYIKLLSLVKDKENRMFYLAVAPEFFEVIAKNIKESGLGDTKGWKRLIIEKPFGHDLVSAQELNDKLSHSFTEEEIYRIDHYLGKNMVQNLEVLRTSNPILETLWNNKNVSNVQITAIETVGVEERAGYYDHTGAMKDMIQNHLLQLLMLTAMNLPKSDVEGDIHRVKKEVLEALRPVNLENFEEHIVRAQYTKGSVNGKEVVSYKDAPGVSPDSKTETYLAARLFIDNARWSGVPFYIRSGKSLSEKSTKIVVEYKSTLETASNELVININPSEGITLQVNSKNPLNGEVVEPVALQFLEESKEVAEAYERLIFDAMKGNSTFFAHWSEVELAWKFVQPILDAFKENVPLHYYEAGSEGPLAANKLLEKDGFKWE
jgi:glucose-6-phosphate 1-dehydrogenase